MRTASVTSVGSGPGCVPPPAGIAVGVGGGVAPGSGTSAPLRSYAAHGVDPEGACRFRPTPAS